MDITNLFFIPDNINSEIEKFSQQNQNKIIKTGFSHKSNGYLDIGHAKAIYLNYIFAEKTKGEFNIRMDDINP